MEKGGGGIPAGKSGVGQGRVVGQQGPDYKGEEGNEEDRERRWVERGGGWEKGHGQLVEVEWGGEWLGTGFSD